MKLFQSLVLLIAISALPTNAPAQMGDADVRFVPDNCFFVLQFDMQKLFGYEKMGSKNLENIAKFFKEEAGLDLLSMKTLTLQFCNPEGERNDWDEDFFGLAMTFSRPIDKEKFMESISADYNEAEFEGKKYLEAGESYQPALHFPDDKSLVMAMTPTLKLMIGKKSKDVKIRALLKSADPEAEIKGAFQTADLYLEFLSAISQEIPVSPFNIETVFGEAQSAVISGNVRSSTPIYFQVECKTEEGAEKLAKKTMTLVKLGKASIPLGRESMEAMKKEMEGREQKSPFDQFRKGQIEMSLKGLDVAEKILMASETSHQGKRAIFKVKMMGGIKNMMPMIAEMFSAQVLGMRALQSDLDAPIDGLEFEIEEAAIK